MTEEATAAALADKIKRLNNERGGKKAAMTKLINNIEDLIKEYDKDKGTAAVTAKLDRIYAKVQLIPSKLKEIERVNKDIVSIAPSETIETIVIEGDDYTNHIEEQRIVFNRWITRQENNESMKPVTPASPPDAGKSSRTNVVNLPKLELTKFTGEVLEWPEFFDTFKAAVHEHPGLSNAQRLQYLRGQLDGEAKRLIDGLQLTDANYKHAMELLQERFGKTYIIKEAYMKALWNLGEPTDIIGLKLFYDKLETYIRGLKALGKEEHTYGDLLVPLILDRIPRKLRHTITRDHGAKEWQLKELREALKKEIDTSIQGDTILDDLRGNDEMDSTEGKPTATMLNNTNTGNENDSKRSCVFCSKDNHTSARCLKVSDPKMRFEIVKNAGLCFRCFGNHRFNRCKSKTACARCKNRNHHTALHDPARVSKPKAQEQSDNSDPVHANLINQNRIKPLTLGPTLLKTAVTTAKSDTRCAKVNIILDEGSQRSFITAKCASNLQLKSQSKEMVSIAPFGQNAKATRALQNVNVMLNTTGEEVIIKALIVPKISAPLKTCTSSILDMPHLKGLKFADNVTDAFMEIDILIGADHYWSIVGDEIVRPKGNQPGPVAVSSKFGFLLSGPTPASNEAPPVYTPALITSVLGCLSVHNTEERIVKAYWELETIDPSKASDVKENIYVDNIVSGVSDTKEALEFYDKANSLMKDGGFKLRAWASNNEELRNKATTDGLNEAKVNDVNILGMKWDTECDKLYYAKKQAPSQDILPTKREVISYSSSIFDPFGYLSPVMVKAKAFQQELWKQGLDWDEPIPADLANTWKDMTSELEQVQTTEIPRKLIENLDPGNCELHAFSDASPTAYGCTVYLKSGNNVSLIIAKTRLKPLKETTIPRMELLGAITACRLAKYTQEALKGIITLQKQFIWIDSQIVLHWIDSDKKLPVFVKNRIDEMKTFPGEFRYVNTKDNPADLLTRGISAQELKESKLWWSGPRWLQTDELPQQPKVLLTEEKVTLLFQQTGEAEIDADEIPIEVKTSPEANIMNIMDIKRYSSYTKLLRVTALVKRFIVLLKKKPMSTDGISAKDITMAEETWIKALQRRTYGAELDVIFGRKLKGSIGENNKAKNLVKQLRLFEDNQGIIRLDGRLHNAQIDLDTKFPILLPNKHPFTDLIIERAHTVNFHAGMQTTVTSLRQRFWIPSIREAVNACLRCCTTCKKLFGRPYAKPEAPPLQANRIQQSPPWTVTGCDYTGALYVYERRETGKIDANTSSKVYIALFTCAVTRAVHLEVVPDMTTASFLNAFRRFTARRSTPSKMISDNATTFVAASEEIAKIMKDEEVKTYLSDQRVTWSFNVPRAPWWGGWFERLIGLTKRAIIKTLGRAKVTYDELVTVVTQVEGILNSRPLTYIGDTDPLTPAHLMYGKPITGLPYQCVDIDELADPDFGNTQQLEKRMKRLAFLLQHFWKRWSNEYIPALRERHIRVKKGKLENSIKVGDVVLVYTDNEKRINWPLAKIESLVYGKDGLVRSAQIKTKFGTTNRPIARLYPLEVCSAEPHQVKPSIAQAPETTDTVTSEINAPKARPTRKASEKAKVKIKQLARNDMLSDSDDEQ